MVKLDFFFARLWKETSVSALLPWDVVGTSIYSSFDEKKINRFKLSDWLVVAG